MSERYSAQLGVDGWDDAAQARLAAANLYVIGAGGRGCVVAAYLAAAGAGRLSVIDGDEVALDGLHRQLLHFTPDVTANKAESVRAKLGLINAEVHVEPFPAHVDEQNAEMILEGADCVIDCTNDYATSLLINDVCVAAARPVVFGTTNGWLGSVMTVVPGKSACLRCADAEEFQAPGAAQPSLGPIAGAIGSLQALEALKLAAVVGAPRIDQILMFDGRDSSWDPRPVQRRADCICASG